MKPLQQQHLPFLDGLRGISIIAVMLFHFTQGVRLESYVPNVLVQACSGLFLGVDVFFVISGFLITRILINASATKSSLKAFFARRSLRIFPPYWLYLLVCLGLLPVLDHYEGREELKENFLWYFTYTNNILIAREGWPWYYFAHLWSLAVEEQFYLLWPIILFVPILRRNWLYLLLIMILFPPILRAWMIHAEYPGYIPYVLLPTRLDGLALGGLIAFCEATGTLRICHRGFKWLALPSGIFLAMYLTGRASEVQIFPGVVSAAFQHFSIAILTGAMITTCLVGRQTLPAILSINWLCKVGKVSYSLYLWHYMVRDFSNLEGFGPRNVHNAGGAATWYLLVYIPLAGMISYLIALLSWKFFEKPILSLKRFFQWETKKKPDPESVK